MSKINEVCAGIDVGKRFLLCCVLTGAAQDEPRSETLRFDTTARMPNTWLTCYGTTTFAQVIFRRDQFVTCAI